MPNSGLPRLLVTLLGPSAPVLVPLMTRSPAPTLKKVRADVLVDDVAEDDGSESDLAPPHALGGGGNTDVADGRTLDDEGGAGVGADGGEAGAFVVATAREADVAGPGGRAGLGGELTL